MKRICSHCRREIRSVLCGDTHVGVAKVGSVATHAKKFTVLDRATGPVLPKDPTEFATYGVCEDCFNTAYASLPQDNA